MDRASPRGTFRGEEGEYGGGGLGYLASLARQESLGRDAAPNLGYSYSSGYLNSQTHQDSLRRTAVQHLGSTYISPLPLESISETPQPNIQRSQSEPVRSEEGNLQDITLIHPSDRSRKNAIALLETGCLTGNWISRRLVNKLCAQNFVNPDTQRAMRAADGGIVQSQGTLRLDWRWTSKGVQINTATFHVWDAPHHDVIIGNEYITQNGLLSWNEDAFSPLTEHKSVSEAEAEAMRQAALRQQQEKAAREAARNGRWY